MFAEYLFKNGSDTNIDGASTISDTVRMNFKKTLEEFILDVWFYDNVMIFVIFYEVIINKNIFYYRLF